MAPRLDAIKALGRRVPLLETVGGQPIRSAVGTPSSWANRISPPPQGSAGSTR